VSLGVKLTEFLSGVKLLSVFRLTFNRRVHGELYRHLSDTKGLVPYLPERVDLGFIAFDRVYETFKHLNYCVWIVDVVTCLLRVFHAYCAAVNVYVRAYYASLRKHSLFFSACVALLQQVLLNFALL